MTAAAALVADAAATLAAAGAPAPEWDAERLLRHVLGWDRAALVANRFIPGRDAVPVLAPGEHPAAVPVEA